MKYIVSPGGELRGELRPPSDKSISHRAVLLAALANGDSEIHHALLGEDVCSTIAAVRACGVDIQEDNGRLLVKGCGTLSSPAAEVHCGNAGTLMRLFCGVAAGWDIDARLVGDESLMRRPMRRVTEPLAQMGARISAAADGCPPVLVSSGGRLRGITHTLPMASAQVKSALLLAGLRAEGETTVIEPEKSRDHTERMLEVFGAPPKREKLKTTVVGGVNLSPARVNVPADLSSAAFFMVGAAIAPNSELVLKEVGINPTRYGIIELLRRMGAQIDVLNPRQIGAEPAADLRIVGSELRGISIEAADVPTAIDDFPALFIAAAAARGETRLSGAAELRHKESDRIAAMVDGLQTLGVGCEATDDGVIIEGDGGQHEVFDGGDVDSHGDHRIAMALAMAALRARKNITVRNCRNVATSFPNFAKKSTATGLRLAVQED